jgi:hypothetical protein
LANLGGGCLVVGVGEMPDKTLESKGLTSFTDTADIVKGIKKFLPNNLLTSLQILSFSYDAAEYPTLVGKKFQVVIVEDDPKHLPAMPLTKFGRNPLAASVSSVTFN